jgi:hypothetical protein
MFPGAYIFENISRYHLGKKYVKGGKKRKCKRKRKKEERKRKKRERKWEVKG